MNINSQLAELYNSKFENLKNLFSELQKREIYDYSWPLLL